MSLPLGTSASFPTSTERFYRAEAPLHLARRTTHHGWEDPYALVPVTLTPDAANTIHLNLGWTRNREARSDSMLWGVAAEHAFSDRFALVGETFGTDRERPFVRAGARWTAAKGLDFDISVVARSGGSSADRYLSVGLTWQSAPFLP